MSPRELTATNRSILSDQFFNNMRSNETKPASNKNACPRYSGGDLLKNIVRMAGGEDNKDNKDHGNQSNCCLVKCHDWG